VTGEMHTTVIQKRTGRQIVLIRLFRIASIFLALIYPGQSVSASLNGKKLFCETTSQSRYKDDHLNTIFVAFTSDSKALYQQGVENEKTVEVDLESDITKIKIGKTWLGPLFTIDRTTLIGQKESLGWSDVKMTCELVSAERLRSLKQALLEKTQNNFKL
jgi:hypothetical protein